MRVVLLPPPRVALRLPAVRSAVLLAVLGPALVAWGGIDEQAIVRLRYTGLLLAGALAMVWDDRCAVVTAPTPVGVPAVRRGRAVVVLCLLGLAWLLSCAVVSGQRVPYAALTLQTSAVAVLLLAVVGWLARDREGEQLAALPAPALLLTMALLSRLPSEVSLLRATPGSAGWPAERSRWLVLLVVATLLVVRLGRDPARR